MIRRGRVSPFAQIHSLFAKKLAFAAGGGRDFPMRIAVILQLDTEHGRGILRGVGRFFRQHPEATVWKFGRAELAGGAVLRRLAPDGVIARVATASEERALGVLGVPVINVSGARATPRLPTVNTDDALVGRFAARHLIAHGYRTLAFLGSEGHLASVLRGRAFAAEARRRGLPVHRLVGLPPPEAGTGRADPELTVALQRLPRPLGVFGFTDALALAAVDACQAAGMRVPQDAGVLGVGNDLTRLDFAHVEVSSVQLNTARIGELAAEQLWSWLRTGRRPRRLSLLAPLKIVTRRSTDAFAVPDETVAQALEHIRAHAGNPVYVADVARAAGVSRRVLELRFRRHLGSSVYAEVQRVHFEQAAELLAASELTVSEIAFASGFESPQRFTTAFRARYGMPPTRYRLRLSAGRPGG